MLARTTVLIAVAFVVVSAPAFATELSVPSTQFPDIQSALNAAQPGDVVRVSPLASGAPYNAPITISTSGVRLEGVNDPVLDGTGFTGNGITVTAARVTVTGFVVQNFHGPQTNFLPGAGILVANTTNADIHDNTLQNDGFGVEVYGPFNPSTPQTYSITDNAILNNDNSGAFFFGTDGELVFEHNEVDNNASEGLGAQLSDGLKIRHNEFIANGILDGSGGCGYGLCGTLYVGQPVNPNVIEENYMANNFGPGVNLQQDSNSIIDHNVCYANQLGGILLGDGEQCVVSFNTTTFSFVTSASDTPGIALYQFGVGSMGNQVTHNDSENNGGDGIVIDAVSVGNALSFNHAVNNTCTPAGTCFDMHDFTGTSAATVQNTYAHDQFGTSSPTGLP